jgi:hypothetical protein
MLDERIGHWQFWTMLIGFNLTFAPMHVLGLNGMPRRIYTYPEGMGWELWNRVETVGSIVIALSVLMFMYNVWVTRKQGKVAGNDPWDARTLEWTIPSPPPEYNFETIPTVRARDPFWHDKYVDPLTTEPHVASAGTDPAEQPPLAVAAHDAQGGHGEDGHGIHMPSPSFYPLVAAIGLVVAAYGLLLTRTTTELLGFFGNNAWFGLVGVGVVILCAGVYGWALEPVTDDHAA